MMALEDKIDALVAALDRNTAAHAANPTKAAGKKPANTAEMSASATLQTGQSAGSVGQPTVTPASLAATQTLAGNAAATSVVSAAAATTQPAVATVDAETLGKSLVALCEVRDPVSNALTGRAKAIEILAKYGSKDFGGLKIEIYGAAKADFDAAAAALKAPAVVSGAGGLI